MRAAQLLPDLIRAAGGGPERVLERVAAALPGFRARATKGEPRAVLFTRGAPRLALSGHVDVVPVGEGWQRDPFGGDASEGRIWGRGACDMLGSVACFVEAAHRAPDAPCAILLTTDEETGMRAAELALRDGLLDGIGAVVVGEPTSMRVGVAEKGVLWLRAEATGVNAHGSMPELGDNAVLRAIRIASRLDRLRPPGRHPILGEATLSVNRIGGGDAVNQVPAAAFVEADVRYLPGTTDREVLALVAQATAPEAGKATVRVLSNHAPFEIDPASPLARAAMAAAGTDAIGLPYGTEASKYAPAGLPTVILGPGDASLAHTNRESIALSALDAGTAAYAALLEAHAA